MTKLHKPKNPHHIATLTSTTPVANVKTIPTNRSRRNMNTSKLDKLPMEFKAKWISALRGKNYKQGFGVMFDPETDKYDALGVAHRIAGVPAKSISGVAYPERRFKFIPNVLTEGSDLVDRLASFNDKGLSFKWIASYIEGNH